MLKTKTNTEYITDSKRIQSDCIAITFFRPDSATTNPVKVNGVPVEQGKTIEISQPHGCLDTTEYDILFDSGGGGSNELYVIKILPVVNQF